MAAKRRTREWPSRRYGKKHRRPPVTDRVKWQFVQDWMQDMYQWCRLVRADIRRLEKAAGLPAGDPGDPPPPPPPPDLPK